MSEHSEIVLGIETSCDETAAAVWSNGRIISNIISSQIEHSLYGGVVPELASRAHQQMIHRIVDEAIEKANIQLQDISAIGVTRGPGLPGSLHVGVSFAAGMAWAIGKPLLGIHHMHAHIMAHFISTNSSHVLPEFPFICLTVSGGHTQLVLMRNVLDFEILGQTIDDAAGEALDKAAKIMGLPYPGGPEIDRLAQLGDPLKYRFTRPKVGGHNFSFSGLKTALLYFLKQEKLADSKFIERELQHICASYQHAITDYLIDRLEQVIQVHSDIHGIALAGGVSANTMLRDKFTKLSERLNLKYHIPPTSYCTDNAAMIACTAAYMLREGVTSNKHFAPMPSWPLTRAVYQ